MAITTVSSHVVSVNAIQGTLIADNAITAVHIATNAVSGTLIADNAVTATHIAQNTITVTQIADDAINAHNPKNINSPIILIFLLIMILFHH